MKQTLTNLKLIDLQETLMDKLLVDTGIDPKSFNYEKDTFIVSFDLLKGFDMKKAYDEYMVNQAPYSKVMHDEVLFGKELLFNKVLQYFPKYKNLEKYQIAFKQPCYTCDTQKFCQVLD